MPTKSSCRKAVDDLIHYIDSTFPEHPGILSESVPEKVMKERREVIQVLFNFLPIDSRNCKSFTRLSPCSVSPCYAGFVTTTPDSPSMSAKCSTAPFVAAFCA